jgi:CubicO group peptidase (beta-lactamase class C family)
MYIDHEKLDRVVNRFSRQQQTGAFPGGQLVLRSDGKPVLNKAVGLARGFRPQEHIQPVKVSGSTPFPLLSAGKPLAATVVAMLEDRGVLDINRPIARIFPEFAAHGKQHITTLDVLTHRSGLLMPEFIKDIGSWGDREAVQKALIETVPTYPRGTRAYHPYEYGWILDEIVRRVDGRSLPDFFADEIANPLGLPALCFGLAGRESQSIAFTYWLGKEKVMVAGVNVAEGFEDQNAEQYLDARNPATSLVADASSLAAFYDFILSGGKTPEGRQLISEKTLHQYTAPAPTSWDRSLKTFIAVGRGFVIGSRFLSNYGFWDTGSCFGHAGGFSSLAFGDYKKNISAAIVTNGNRSMMDFARRFIPFAQGLRAAVQNQS